jgi:general secretion pathway protein D
MSFKRVPSSLLLLALLCLIVSANPGSAAEDGKDNSRLEANLENITLIDFVKFYGKFTGRNVVFEESKLPGAPVSIYSHGPISEGELNAIFERVLANHSLYPVSKGNILYIMRDKEAEQLKPGLGQAESPGRKDELMTTIYGLGNDFSPQVVSSLLKDFTSPIGKIQEIPRANALLIQDNRGHIKKMIEVLDKVLAMSPKYKIKVISVEESKAADVTQKINEFYSGLSKKGQMGEQPLLTALEWANSILAAGTREQLKSVSDLVDRMDQTGKSTESRMEVFRLQNAKATSAAQVLQGLSEALTKEGKKKETGEPPMKVSADSETNSVIVMADNEAMEQVKKVLKKLDRPLEQVYVQALIMETSLNNAQNFGVEWYGGAETGNGDNIGTLGYLNSGESSLLKYAKPVIEDNDIPDFGALPGGFSLGFLGNMITYQGKKFPSFGALVDFVRSNTGFNILSTPQIMTLDNAEARVFVGENRPFKTQEKSAAAGENIISNFTFKDVGIELIITPYINADNGMIRMDIEQSWDKVKTSETAAAGLPVTISRSTRTSVQLRDSSTMIISGLVENSENLSQSHIPGISSVPVLGWLFKKKNDSFEYKTLMVFLNANIIRSQQDVDQLTKSKFDKSKRLKGKTEKFLQREFGEEENATKSKRGLPKTDGFILEDMGIGGDAK